MVLQGSDPKRSESAAWLTDAEEYLREKYK